MSDIQRYRAAEQRLWEHVGAAPTERSVELPNGASVRVQELGEGPPFVLLHGGSICGTSWCTLAAALEGVRCILVDRPGCGLSDRIPDGPLRNLPAVKHHADGFLVDLLDALELDSAAVGSTSYGGYFAFRGAASAPERVSRIVEYSWLIGAPSDSVPLASRLAALPGSKDLMVRMPMSRWAVKEALRQFGLGRAMDAGTFDDEMIDWAHALMRHTDTLRNDVLSSPDVITPIRGQNTDLLLTDALLSKLEMPVLFLWGADDPNGGEAVARAFAPRLPDAELVVIPDAEHAPWLDDLDLCVERTREFLLGQEGDG